MRGITEETRRKIKNAKCARADEGGCAGGLTIEHPLLFGGKQIKEPWAEIILCERHHSSGRWQDRGLLDKQLNVMIALNQATEEELRQYSKVVDLIELRNKLRREYDNSRRRTDRTQKNGG